jgi:hypothetical protein
MRQARTGGDLVHAGSSPIAAVIAAFALVFVIETTGPHETGPVSAGSKADRLTVSGFQPIGFDDSVARATGGPNVPDDATMVLASLEVGTLSGQPSDDDAQSDLPVPPTPRDSFDDRFSFRGRLASFEERFEVTGMPPSRLHETGATEQPPDAAPTGPAAARTVVERTGSAAPRAIQKLAIGPSPSRPIAAKQRLAALEPPQQANSSSGTYSHAAIYDIAAHTVYLPNGERLEAHSGLGTHRDDPESVGLRSRGATPPNVYDLSLRERSFYGVRAIRLTPVDEDKMFGRAGILAHSYLHGVNGDSNGCVAFSDYHPFLNAYLRGDINRLVVVRRLEDAPSQQRSSGWLANAIGNMFRSVERSGDRRHPDDSISAIGYR